MHPQRQASLQLKVSEYESGPNPLRLSIGDIIRSSTFEIGIRMNGDHKILVGWRDETYPQSHAASGLGTLKHDATRSRAPFLVSGLAIVENTGPDDALPCLRLAMDVTCVRLTETYLLHPDAEVITFSQYEPMSVAQPTAEPVSYTHLTLPTTPYV